MNGVSFYRAWALGYLSPKHFPLFKSGEDTVNSGISERQKLAVTVAETLKKLQEHFNAEAAAGLNKTIQLNISGPEAGKWAIKIANQACELIPDGVEKPDLTLSLADKDWIAIIERKLDPMNAYMTGKLKTTGEMTLAMRIPSLFALQ